MTTLRGICVSQKNIITGKKIVDLPVEIIVHILRFTDAVSIVNLSRVSWLFYNIATTYDWYQLYTPKETHHINTQIKFMNILYLNNYTCRNYLSKIKKIETIFINNDYEYLNNNIFEYVHIHSLRTECKNIIFNYQHNIVKQEIFLYLSPKINYYYIDSFCEINSHIHQQLTEKNIFFEKYDMDIHFKINRKKEDYSKIINRLHILHPMGIGVEMLHTLFDEFLKTPETNNPINNKNKYCLSRYEKSIIKNQNKHRAYNIKIQQRRNK